MLRGQAEFFFLFLYICQRVDCIEVRWGWELVFISSKDKMKNKKKSVSQKGWWIYIHMYSGHGRRLKNGCSFLLLRHTPRTRARTVWLIFQFNSDEAHGQQYQLQREYLITQETTLAFRWRSQCNDGSTNWNGSAAFSRALLRSANLQPPRSGGHTEPVSP